MSPASPIRRKPSEQGYVLLAVLILLFVFIIAMAVAAPRIAASIQRDREVETMHRGKQYIRAIQLYYRQFNAYPPSIDALVKTNNIRFLRKRYIDPMTGKDDWKPIMFGQNKTPMAMGFFGQPLDGTGGAVLAGTGPSGGNGMAGATGIGGGGLFSSGSGASSTSPMGGGLFSSGSGTSTTPGTTPTTGTGTSGTDTSGGTSGTDSGSSGLGSGQTFGGGGIIGYSPAISKPSILTYKKKNHYNEWEFTYSPLMDQQMMGGGNTGTIGTPAGSTGQTTTTGGFGSPSGGFGSTSGSTTPTAPSGTTTPQ